MAFADQANGYRLKVQKYTGATWSNTVGTAGFSAANVYNPMIAIDPGTNTPYVAYFDASVGQKVTVQKFTAGAWNVVGQTGFSEIPSTTPLTNNYRVLGFSIMLLEPRL